MKRFVRLVKKRLVGIVVFERDGACMDGVAGDEILIRPLEIGEDGTAFRVLNEEWISRYFRLEAKDRETLGDPEGTILGKGACIRRGRAAKWLGAWR